MEKEKLKELLEQTALESGLKIKGEIAEIKSPEQKEAEKEIQEWKESNREYVDIKEFDVPNELIKCLLNTSKYEGLIFSGEGGIGKTILTISAIKKILKPSEWEFTNGYITPLSLYEFLYNNRNKKVIIIDDVEGIFNNKLSLAILKGCLWESESKRICQYASKSDKATAPDKFVMNAKVVILCNDIPKENDVSTRALISRTIFYKMGFSFGQKMKICENFVLNDESINFEQKKIVLEIMKQEITEATKDFNFRTLQKLIAFVQYNREKAVGLFKATTEIDELKNAYLEAVRRSGIVKEQVEFFIENTGMSRRTFFRVKKEMSDRVPQKLAIDTGINDTQVKGGGENGEN